MPVWLENRKAPGQTGAMYRFTLAQTELCALPSGALYWPDQSLLVVSDLHFGKSERLARRGGALLPPYETRATLERLDADVEATTARRVLCLGDSFDDLAAADGLDEADRLWLLRLMSGREWTWIEGNHDTGPLNLGGSHLAEWRVGPLAFRHIASPYPYEISGHYHPKARLAGRTQRCFLIDQSRVIMPAYGAYTGGLWTHDPAFAMMATDALALLTGRRVLPIPMPR
jgi:DNA ligase-associated metallophosphoesterase